MQSLKIIDHPECEQIIIENQGEKEVKRGIPYATQKLNYIFYHSR